uniref:Secreted protein n=1 Tax=Physcomitrium patens TaxID=3218 RepID=A0A2K1JQU2_PHYPA|nr:hypothetical protein PHYPA_016290 [Physcomitrium patens]
MQVSFILFLTLTFDQVLQAIKTEETLVNYGSTTCVTKADTRLGRNSTCCHKVRRQPSFSVQTQLPVCAQAGTTKKCHT